MAAIKDRVRGVVMTFRLYIGHLSMPSSDLKPTQRFFEGKTKEFAERRARRFIRDAQLNHMVWELREDGGGLMRLLEKC